MELITERERERESSGRIGIGKGWDLLVMDNTDLWLISIVFLTCAASVPSAFAYSSGCFWTESCRLKGIETCGSGRVVVDRSDDCHGLCSQPLYPTCLPIFTRFQCCSEDEPLVSDVCARCANRVDVGDDWMCCSDCSDVKVINTDKQTGFCKTGAQLSSQAKDREVFKWMTRDWSDCSPCGGGYRQRSVHCLGRLEHSPQRLYHVNDTKCGGSWNKPSEKEFCYTSCKELSKDSLHIKHKNKRRGKKMGVFAIVVLSTLTIVGAGGLVFVGLLLYKRRENKDHGFVYVMMEGYN